MDPAQPVVLVPSRPEEWTRRFALLSSRLALLVPGARIEHIGSTAVPSLPAKDVVDVLVGVRAGSVVPAARLLASAGFDLEGEHDHHCWLSSPDRRHRDAVLHVVEHGSRPWMRRLEFRDLLRRDAAAREEYLRAKRDAARVAGGLDDYTFAKTDVVTALLATVPLPGRAPDHPAGCARSPTEL